MKLNPRFQVSLSHAALSAPAPVPPPMAYKPEPMVTELGESYQQTFRNPAAEAEVYTTVRQWRAIDVYLNVTSVRFTTYFTVRVYAIMGSLRTLVATGRVGSWTQRPLATPVAGPIYCAAARAQATKFEVTLEHQDAAGLPFEGDVSVAVVATNEANEPPPWVGVIRMRPNAIFAPINSFAIPDPELVSVQGVVGELVGAPRFLHVHDRPAADPYVGEPPAFVIPMFLPIGGAGGFYPVPYRSKSGFLTIAISEQVDLTVEPAVPDCVVQAFVR